jgi:uncharacterized membrane protein
MAGTLPIRGLTAQARRFLKVKDGRTGGVRVLLGLAIASYTFYTFQLTVFKHNAFRSTAWDLGIFMQAFWTTVYDQQLLYYTPELYINPGGSFFGIHFSPILLLLIPTYAVSPRAETLLFLQSLAIALAAVPIFFIARDKLGSEPAALMISIVYLLYLPVHELNWFDFHFEAFIPITLLSAFYFFERAVYGKAFTFFLLTLACNEFMPVIVSCFALYFSLKTLAARFQGVWNAEASRRLLNSLILLLISLAWFSLALNVIHMFNPGVKVAGHWEYWGLTPIEIAYNLLANPAKTLAFILTREKLMYLIYLMAPLGFIPIAGILEFVFLVGAWLLPAWISTFNGYYGGFLSPQFQYGGFVAAQVFIAFIYGLKNLKLGGMALTRAVTLFLCVSLVMAAAFSPFGAGLLRPYFKQPQITPHEDALAQMVSLIPEDASILTQNHVFPHVANRVKAYVWPIFPKILKEPPSYAKGTKYILFDLTKAGFNMTNYTLNLIQSGEYGVFAAADYIILLKREYHGPQVNLNLKHGLLMKIYNNPKPEGEPVLEMPVFSLNHAGLILSWREGWCSELKGYLYVPEEGTYRFRIDSAEPSKMVLDGLEAEGSPVLLQADLEAGYHKIYILWNGGKSAYLYFYWKPPWDDGFKPIPLEYLYFKEGKAA